MALAKLDSALPIVGPERPFIVARPDFDSLEPAPLPDGWVISGDPAPRMRILTSSDDAVLMSGIWRCDAGRFHFRYDFDETVHLLSGGVRVTINGYTQHLVPGDVAYFARGTTSVWEVDDQVQKYFVQRNASKLERIVQRLGSGVNAAASVLFS